MHKISPNTAVAINRSRCSTSSAASRSSPRIAARDSSNVHFAASTKSLLISGGSSIVAMPTPQLRAVEDDDDDDDIADDDPQHNNNSNIDDFIPTTSAAETCALDLQVENAVLQEMIEKHHRVFMSHTFPPSLAGADNLTDIQLWCCPQQELDNVIFVLSNWQPTVNLKTMKAGPDKEQLTKFRRGHKGGNKFKKKYHLEMIQVPGSDPRTVIR